MSVLTTETWQFTLELPEVDDGALLMELLEDSNDDRLIDLHVGNYCRDCGLDGMLDELDKLPEVDDGALLMELLEDSNDDHLIGLHVDNYCRDCGLDGMLDELDDHECSESSSTTYILNVDDVYDWGEVDGERGWYVDAAEMVMNEEDESHESGCDGFYYAESRVEELYIPLWQ